MNGGAGGRGKQNITRQTYHQHQQQQQQEDDRQLIERLKREILHWRSLRSEDERRLRLLEETIINSGIQIQCGITGLNNNNRETTNSFIPHDDLFLNGDSSSHTVDGNRRKRLRENDDSSNSSNNDSSNDESVPMTNRSTRRRTTRMKSEEFSSDESSDDHQTKSSTTTTARTRRRRRTSNDTSTTSTTTTIMKNNTSSSGGSGGSNPHKHKGPFSDAEKQILRCALVDKKQTSYELISEKYVKTREPEQLRDFIRRNEEFKKLYEDALAMKEENDLSDDVEDEDENIDGTRYKKGAWTTPEHEALLRGIKQYGRDYERIAEHFVHTRTVKQIRDRMRKRDRSYSKFQTQVQLALRKHNDKTEQA